MVRKNIRKIILSSFVIVFSILFSLIFSSNLVSSQSVDCFRYTGNYTGCVALNSSCSWGNNSGAVPMDPFCAINSGNYNDSLAVMWAPWLQANVAFNILTGGSIINSGCCIMKMGGGGGGGNNPQSCFSFDGNQTGCETANVTLGIQPAGIAISPSGKFAYATNYNSLYNGDQLVPGEGTVQIIAKRGVVSDSIIKK